MNDDVERRIERARQDENRLARIESQQSAQTQLMTQVRDDNKAVNTKLEEHAALDDQRNTSIDNRLMSVNTQLTTLSTIVTAVQTDTSEIKKQITELAKQIAMQNGRVGTLERAVWTGGDPKTGINRIEALEVAGHDGAHTWAMLKTEWRILAGVFGFGATIAMIISIIGHIAGVW